MMSGHSIMDLAQAAEVKTEPRDTQNHEKMADIEPGETNGPPVDFNKLYGDLYNKLIHTPVKDIFPQIPSTATVISPVLTAGSPLLSQFPTMLHPAFPGFGAYAFPTDLLDHGNASPSSNGATPRPKNKDVQKTKQRRKSVKEERSNGHQEASTDQSPTTVQDAMEYIFAQQMKDIDDDMDVQKLVEEFRVTLERFGVSQRFAARFIMQDTSQGNLSFLMEKGKNRKWSELSPRGRIPYLRMKAWLESPEQQKMTMNMLKHSQDMKKSSPRESYSRRERFSMFQINVLCRLFEENPNPPMNIRNAVAERLSIPLDRVNVWFQNQRARGFPARKFLDQSIQTFSDEMDPLLNIPSPAIRKIARRPSGNSLADGNSRSSDFDLLHNKEDVPMDMSMTSQAQWSRLERMHGRFSTPQKSQSSKVASENSVDQPLDFSTSKLSGSDAPSTPNSSISIDALSHIVNNMKPSQTVSGDPTHTKAEEFHQTNMKNETFDGASFNEKTSDDRVASGAAKRKRGMKPHQIIYRPHENTLGYETGIENRAKQESEPKDLSGMSSKRFKSEPRDTPREECYKNGGKWMAEENTYCSMETKNAQAIESKEIKSAQNDSDEDLQKCDKSFEYVYEIGHSEDCVEEEKMSHTRGTIFSAEETVALVQTLYKNQLLDKKKDITVTEPDLD